MSQIFSRQAGEEARSTSVRRYHIHQVLLRDRFTNCSKLAQELEVGVRTVLRDIEAMRRMNYPIDYDAKRRAYFYTQPVYNLPSIQISEGELLALRVASCALEQNLGTPFYRQLSRIYRVLLAGLRGQEVASERVGAAFSFYHVGVGLVRPEVFEKLTHAVLHSVEVEFDYKRPEDERPKRHRVKPYYITNRDNLFYLLAKEDDVAELKAFAIPRIRGTVRLSGSTFIRARRHSLTKRFKHAFRVLAGERLQHVKLRINARTAPYIRERSWHASQKLTNLANGGLLLEMDLSDIRDIKPWVLRWGPDIEVLEPTTLRNEIADLVRQAAAVYH